MTEEGFTGIMGTSDPAGTRDEEVPAVTMTLADGSKEFVGAWEIGGPNGLSVYLTERPNIFRRFFAKLFFGIKWIDNGK